MSTASTVVLPPPAAHLPPSSSSQENGIAEAPEPSSTSTRTKRSTMATIKLMFSSDIRNGHPNPVHIAIANRGYDIQSRVLRIPDRFGMFSPGPPCRSAFEGHAFVFAILYLVLVAIAFAGCVVGLEAIEHQRLEVPITFAVLYVGLIITFWVVIIRSPQRKLDYYWGDNPATLLV